MKILLTLILILGLFSCQENKKNNKLNINIIANDTVYKKATTFLNSRYKFIGQNGNSGEIILSEKTGQKIGGKFNSGMLNIKNPVNKAFLFLTDQKIKFDSLPDLLNPTDFSLVDEFQKSTSEKNLKSQLIEKDEDALTNQKAYKLTFAFIRNQKDTVGFQNTYQIIINNRFCSINYLNDTRENFKELEREFEGLALRIK